MQVGTFPLFFYFKTCFYKAEIDYLAAWQLICAYDQHIFLSTTTYLCLFHFTVSIYIHILLLQLVQQVQVGSWLFVCLFVFQSLLASVWSCRVSFFVVSTAQKWENNLTWKEKIFCFTSTRHYFCFTSTNFFEHFSQLDLFKKRFQLKKIKLWASFETLTTPYLSTDVFIKVYVRWAKVFGLILEDNRHNDFVEKQHSKLFSNAIDLIKYYKQTDKVCTTISQGPAEDNE